MRNDVDAVEMQESGNLDIAFEFLARTENQCCQEAGKEYLGVLFLKIHIHINALLFFLVSLHRKNMAYHERIINACV